ncbi:hypothetical protein BGZ76_004194 [Entomortierella beljakovae]|nr:hypothetical protein BGZ76_004194 [Entomortierella beljakovae]
MSDITLFCYLKGESQAFPVTISTEKTVAELKKAIKKEKTPRLDDISADELLLWKVSIPFDKNTIYSDITGSSLEEGALCPATRLSSLYPVGLQEGIINIFAERSGHLVYPVMDSFRLNKLLDLEQIYESHSTVTLVVKPDRKSICRWDVDVRTATLDNLRDIILKKCLQYVPEDLGDIFFCNRQKPIQIYSDDHLRFLLLQVKKEFNNRMSISLESPFKNFSSWTFKDVCKEYNLSASTDPVIDVIPSFTDIEAVPLDTDLKIKAADSLIEEVLRRTRTLNVVRSNEAARSIVVGSFLISATEIFRDDLILATQTNLRGVRGNGPVDYSVHSRQCFEYTLGVTEVKKENFVQGVAQNIVQMESALPRKRKRDDSDEDECLPTNKLTSYGIVTDAKEWYFLECSMDENEVVSFRSSKLNEELNFTDKESLASSTRIIFQKLLWLFARMRDEITMRHDRDSNPRSPTNPRKKPSVRP